MTVAQAKQRLRAALPAGAPIWIANTRNYCASTDGRDFALRHWSVTATLPGVRYPQTLARVAPSLDVAIAEAIDKAGRLVRAAAARERRDRRALASIGLVAA
jgi:hypothetical protein